MKMSVLQWADENSPKFIDDAQGYYFAQLKAILSGDLDMALNDDHLEAWRAEMQSLAAFLKGDLHQEQPF
jgi:hypothetical protein